SWSSTRSRRRRTDRTVQPDLPIQPILPALYNGLFAAGRTTAPSEARSAESRGGKSELRRAVRRVTPGQGDLKDSGTETIPPRKGVRPLLRGTPPLKGVVPLFRVRVKRCGKSAPRRL